MNIRIPLEEQFKRLEQTPDCNAVEAAHKWISWHCGNIQHGLKNRTGGRTTAQRPWSHRFNVKPNSLTSTQPNMRFQHDPSMFHPRKNDGKTTPYFCALSKVSLLNEFRTRTSRLHSCRLPQLNTSIGTWELRYWSPGVFWLLASQTYWIL